MSILNNSIVPVSAGGYEIDNSLRFNDDDSAYLSRTPSSAGNRKTWTYSLWMKLGSLDSTMQFLTTSVASGFSDSNSFHCRVETDGSMVIAAYNNNYLSPTQKFRDHSAWYHIVLVTDTTQATASDRMKLYVNGSQVTDFTGTWYPALNADLPINSTQQHSISSRNPRAGNEFWNGYLAEVNFVDGQALTPSDFGESGDYGEWKPIEYTGTYGTNGFYLDFSNEGNFLSATGGTVTTDGDYKVHTFNSSDTFEVTQAATLGSEVEYLVIAGGGSGGGEIAGGGGAGGYRTAANFAVSVGSYPITVGAGGAERSAYANPDAGNSGSDSIFSTITSTGGGGGGGPAGGFTSGRVGGSGGGEWVGASAGGAAGTAGQGNAGGAGKGSTYGIGGGGGGASSVGSNGGTTNGSSGNGGSGTASSITGASITRAGGGGAGTWTSSGEYQGGAGGSGGGGQGWGNQMPGYISNAAGTGDAGTVNTGSGGGGGGNNGSNGGAGGSGVVIIRYKFQ